MRAHLPSRGVTILELMIAVTITLVVIAGAVFVLRSQQKAYSDGSKLRTAEGSARRAVLALERTLPNAGLGIDPALAFDFSGWTTGPCPSTMGGCVKDSVANSDELVFFSRDARYWVPLADTADPVGNAWIITSLSEGSVVINGHGADLFRKGQILLAVCPGGTVYTFFTVGSNTAVPGTPDQVVPNTSVALLGSSTSNPFRRQDLAITASCFSNPGDPARLFLVNKYRFHVRPVSLGALLGGTQYDPLLVLDQGVDMNGDGVIDQNDEVLIAEGIESLQVGYSFINFGQYPGFGAIPMAGATAGSAIAFDPATSISSANTTANTIYTTVFPGAGANPTAPYSASSFLPYASASNDFRKTNHQANIAEVRVSVLARSIASDVQGGTRGTGFLPLLNQNAQPSWVSAYAAFLGGHDGYQRVTVDATVPLTNMTAGAMPYF